MTFDINETVLEIDGLIRKELWFDFHVFRYDGRNLTIAGGIDLSYYHQLEIIFENVFFFNGFFCGWQSNTSQPVFVLPDNKVQLNMQFEIEQGYTLFMFRTEDYKNDVIIATEKISFNTDTVYYYLRENMDANERIADSVKR